MRYEKVFTLHKGTGFLVIALFICAMQFFTPRVYGQLPCPSAGDTCTSPWQYGVSTINVNECDVGGVCYTCQVEISYAIRLCGGIQDISILSIKFNPDSCNCDSAYAGFMWATNNNLDKLQALAFLHLVFENPMGFDPQVGTVGCHDQWRVTYGACASVSFVPGTQKPAGVTLCPGSPCCSTKVKVCRSASGIMTMEVAPPVVPSVPCNQYNPIAQGETCFPNCDWLFNLRVIEDHPMGLIQRKHDGSVIRDIHLNTIGNTTDIVVFNLQGNVVRKISIDVTNQDIYTQITKENDLPRGTYIYAYRINGELKKGILYRH
ncbi:MAG: hypothetical protein U0Y96_03330 [Candidatus Kapaibacterium sp.]